MLKGGVIGFGRMGITHYSILNTHPDVQFVAVCESTEYVVKNLKRYTSLELFNDYKDMLDKAALDFVIVATPTVSHAEIVKAAIQKNIHVFVEKPFSLSAQEGENLVKMLEGKPLVNQVGYFLRFSDVFRHVKKILDDGHLGQVIHYKNEMYGRTVLKPSKSSWRSKKQMGGGCMLDFASHCIDFSDYLFGPVKAATGSMLKNIHSADVEDAVYTNLIHSNDVTGSILVNWSDASYRRPYNRIEIVGTKGKIVADRQEYRLYLHDTEVSGIFTKGWNIHYLPELEKGTRFGLRGAEFTSQLDHFIECIKEKRTKTACTFEDGQRTDCVIEMIKKDFEERCK